MDLNTKYFGKIVLTNDRFDLPIYQGNCVFLDLVHDLVPVIPAFHRSLHKPLAILIHSFIAQFLPFKAAAMLDGLRPGGQDDRGG